MAAAQNDHDERIKHELHAKDTSLKRFQACFQDIDTDGSGEITFDELEAKLKIPSVRAHLAAIGVETLQAESLFKLLDLDNSGSSTVDEFLFGCMRIRGGAKGIDVATLLHENKRLMRWFINFKRYVASRFDELINCERHDQVSRSITCGQRGTEMMEPTHGLGVSPQQPMIAQELNRRL